MGISDLIIATIIVAGCSCILYLSLWRKKGHCSGCDGGCGKPR